MPSGKFRRRVEEEGQASSSSYPVAVRKLLLILKVPRDSLRRELSPMHPKSIHQKAEDIRRNLLDWSHYAAGLKQQGTDLNDYERIEALLQPLQRQVMEALTALAPFVEKNVHAAARRYWKLLNKCLTCVREAIKHLFSPTRRLGLGAGPHAHTIMRSARMPREDLSSQGGYNA